MFRQTAIINNKHRNRGAVMVEAALVFPLLLLLVFGMIELGLLINDSLALNQVAREAARIGAVGGTPDVVALGTTMGLRNPATIVSSIHVPANPNTLGDMNVTVSLTYVHKMVCWGSGDTTLHANIVMRRE